MDIHREILVSLKKGHSDTWMDLEDIVLSEISRSQRTNTRGFHFYDVPRRVKISDTDKLPGAWGMGGEGVGTNGEPLFNGYSFGFMR